MELAPMGAGPAAARYLALKDKREPYLTRARACARLTLPYLFPPEGHTGSTTLYTPYNGAGPRGTLNLSAKLALALVPPNQPFFRFKVDELKTQKDGVDEAAKAQVEEILAEIESTVMSDVEASGDRPVIHETMKHLVVGGNVLFFAGKTDQRIYGLDQYVVLRTPSGKVREIVICTPASREEVEEAFGGTLPIVPQLGGTNATKAEEKIIPVYTHVKLSDGKWAEYQEALGVEIPDTRGSYPKDKSPYLALRMIRVDGEHYGRGYVEQYLGDLKTLESLNKSVTKAAAIAAKVVTMVKPGGSTKVKTIVQAESGDVVKGNAEDVTLMQADKYNDLKTPLELINSIERRLALAFLESTTVRRDAERVTAEEIRFLIQEIEDAHAGLYATLSHEFQLPYVQRKLADMQADGRVPALPKESVKLTIVAGVEALGRGHERERLLSFAGALTKTVGVQIIDAVLFAKKLALAEGVDPKLVRAQEALDQEKNQGMMMEMAGKLGGPAIKAVNDQYMQVTAPAEGAAPTPAQG